MLGWQEYHGAFMVVSPILRIEISTQTLEAKPVCEGIGPLYHHDRVCRKAERAAVGEVPDFSDRPPVLPG